MIKRKDPFDEFAVLLRGETATSLGQAGKKLQAALEALATFDASSSKKIHRQRETLLAAAAEALHAYLVQKELNGISDNEMLKKAYRIPAELWQRLGFDKETGKG